MSGIFSSIFHGHQLKLYLIVSCLILCSGLIPGSMFGQASQQIEVSLQDRKGRLQSGTFQIAFNQVLESGINPLPAAGDPIEFSGEGTEFIEILFSNLKWDDESFKGEIFMDLADISVHDGAILRVSRKEIVLKVNRTSAKKIKLYPKKSGSTTIDIAYRVTDGTATANIVGTFKRPVKISISGSDLQEEPTASVSPETSPQPPPPAPSAKDLEAENEYWLEVVDNMTVKSFEQYLKRYPDGQYASMARDQIKRIQDLEKAKIAEERREEERKKREKERTTSSSRTPTKSKPSSQKDPEEILYALIQENRDPADCETYLSTYEDGQYIDEVTEILEIESPIKILENTRDTQNPNTFLIKLEYVNGDPTFEILEEDDLEEGAYANPNWSATTHTFQIDVAPNQILTILFTDDRGPEKQSNPQRLDTRFDPLIVQNFKIFLSEDGTLAADSVQFNITGGQPPYSVEFIKLNSTEASYTQSLERNASAHTVVLNHIMEQMSEGEKTSFSGSFYLRLVDQRGAEVESVFKNQPQDIVRIFPPKPGLPINLILGIGGVIVAFVIINLILQQRKKARFRKIKEIEDRKKEQRTQQQVSIHKAESHSRSIQPRTIPTQVDNTPTTPL